MTLRRRADRLLVERGLFESRARAKAAIAAGLVMADEIPLRRASDEVTVDAVLRAAPEHPWVSRGGVKLAAALDHFGFDPAAPHACTRSMSAAGSSILGYRNDPRSSRSRKRISASSIGRRLRSCRISSSSM